MHPLVPYSESSSNLFDFHSKKGFRQKKPYDISTKYTSTRRKWRGSGSVTGPRAQQTILIGGAVERGRGHIDIDALDNKLRKKFVAKLGDGSSFGATLTAERKETLGMAVDTILRLARAAKAVKRFDLPLAANELGIPYFEKQVKVRVRRRRGKKKPLYVDRTVFALPDGRQLAKTMASGWLMWSFGAKPLIQDVYNGMDILQRPVPDSKVRSRASDSFHGYYPGKRDKEGRYHDVTQDVEVSVGFSAKVSVSSPNLWLANQMGLTNPAQWVLEAITLSFVADWFSNLSEVVASFSDFHGLSLDDPCMSTLITTKSVTRGVDYFHEPYMATHTETTFMRSPGMLNPPKLKFAYERFQWQRGLNAISLLTGFLK